MPFQFDQTTLKNDDIDVFTDNAGNLVAEHQQTGAQFKYDASSDGWVPVEGLDMQGAPIENAGSIGGTDMTVDSATVNGTTTTDTLEADSATTGTLSITDTGKVINADDSSNGIVFEEELLASSSTSILLPNLSTNEKAGFLIVRNGGSVATFIIRGGGKSVFEISDPSTAFSDVQGETNSVNIYWDGSQYSVQNTFGASVDVNFTLIS